MGRSRVRGVWPSSLPRMWFLVSPVYSVLVEARRSDAARLDPIQRVAKAPNVIASSLADAPWLVHVRISLSLVLTSGLVLPVTWSS